MLLLNPLTKVMASRAPHFLRFLCFAISNAAARQGVARPSVACTSWANLADQDDHRRRGAPLQVACFLCGHEFGTAGLAFHHKVKAWAGGLGGWRGGGVSRKRYSLGFVCAKL